MNRRAGRSNLLRAATLLAGAILAVGSVRVVHAAPRPQDENIPHVITTSLPDAQVGKNYFQVIDADGGKVPWTFSQAGCPNGVSFDTIRGPNSTDTLHGIPTEAGDYNVVITVTDSATPPHSSSKTLKLHVNP